MGGGHTINLVFSRPELFRYAVMMSPAAGGGIATMYPKIAEKPETINKQFKLFWVGVGKDDGLTGPGDKAFSEALTKIGVKKIFTPSDYELIDIMESIVEVIEAHAEPAASAP